MNGDARPGPDCRCPRPGGVRQRHLAVAGAALLATVAVAVAGKTWFWPGTASWADPAPGIHVLTGVGPTVAYVVETPAGLVLIDSGLEPSAAVLTRQLRAAKLDPARLRYILLTHAHADHCLGAQHLRRATGARIYAGRDDSPVLRAGGPRDALFSVYDLPGVEGHTTRVDVELAGGEVIDAGGTVFRALAAPGHTPGSICYLMERGGLRVLFAGDVINTLSTATDAHGGLGTYAAYLPPRYRGNAADYLATLRRLAELPAPDLVLPGHPQQGTEDFRSTPQQWRSLLEHGVREMEGLLARYDADGRNFLDGVPRTLLPGVLYLGDLNGLAVYALATPSGLFLFDAPGGPDLAGFVEARARGLGVKPSTVAAVLLTSCDRECLSGLKALAGRAGCKVIVSRAGVQAVKEAFPSAVVLTENDLDGPGWPAVRAVPLQGRGAAPLAYVLERGGKKVLVSGRIPIKGTPAASEALIRALSKSPGDPGRYRESLKVLGGLRPDVWLPLVPENGQNAFLYDHEWPDMLALNETFVRDLSAWQHP